MKILIPLPQRDFDPTEVAVSWQILAGAGHDVIFATPEGKLAPADPVMLDGIGLDYWSRIPGLKHLTLSALRYVPIAALAPLILHLCTMRHFLRKSSGLFRDSPKDRRPAFVMRDGNYVSARWPGDVHTFARTFAQIVAESIP